MKKLFSSGISFALAVAVAAASAEIACAQDQPAPAPAPATDVLPPNIQPGTPLADVVKLLQADVDPSTIQNFVANSTGAFNLDADTIIYLKDEGLSSDVINAMLNHDKALYANGQATPPPPAPPASPAPDATAPSDNSDDTAAMSPPAAPVTVDYFNTTLSPYGSWVDIDGYGHCWRPTAVIYDSGWRPYCDRGHWVYTDSGWYWDSDYSWGITFHYGRWFRDGHYGWCWLPDTTWGPSWVAWRSSDDYCGWAPLPPFAVFTPGIGFSYRGVACSADFDFGLDADFFVFVSPEHFCDRHPRQFCAPPERVAQIFHTTTIVNNYSGHDHAIVNGGIDVRRISTASHRQITPVHVASLPNAGRQGWRGATPVNARPGVSHPLESHPGNNNNFHGSMEINGNPGRDNSTRVTPGTYHDTRPVVNQNPAVNDNQRDHSLNNGTHINNSEPVRSYQPPVESHPNEPVRTEQRTEPENNFHPSQPAPPVQEEQRPQQYEQRNTEPEHNTEPPQTHTESAPHNSPPPQSESHSSEHSSESGNNKDNH